MSRLLHGVGVNDCGYKVHKSEYGLNDSGKRVRVFGWRCPYYKKWSAMITRCHSEKMIARDPSYSDCYVCDSWLSFSGFIEWVNSQPRKDWESLELDKDILIENNRVYSPETCVFVSRLTNTFLVNRRSNNLTGVFYMKDKGVFRSSCRNPFNGKREHLGFFETDIEAHKAWKVRKRKHAIELSKQQLDERVSKAIVDRYGY